MSARAIFLAALSLALAAPGVLAATWSVSQETAPSLGQGVSLGTSSRPAAVDPSGAIHLVFQSGTAAQGFVIGYASRNAAGEWSSAVVVSEAGRDGRNPSVAVDSGGRIHVVWEDVSGGESDVMYRRRDVGGMWGEVEAVAPAPGLSQTPIVAADAFGRVHCVWIDGRSGQRQVLHALLPPLGEWDAPTILSGGGVQPQEPHVVADGLGTVHVVWSDRGTTSASRQSYDIVYSQITPQSTTGTLPVRIVDHLTSAVQPFLAAAPDGTLHLVWEDDRATSADQRMEIFYKRYLPGIGWGHDKRFTYDGKGAARPAAAVGTSSTVDVVWEDYQSGNSEIFYRQITEPTGWDRATTRLTTDLSPSQFPIILSLPGGHLFLLWTDAQGAGVFRIFAKEGDAQGHP